MSHELHRDPVASTPTSSPQNTSKLRQLSLHHHQQPTMRYQHSQPQQDEGYSEDPSTLSDSDMAAGDEDDDDARKIRMICDLAMTLSTARRKEVVESLVTTLSNMEKEEVKILIDRLTHFDPADYLPNELILSVFSYLSPRDLLLAGGVSRAWRTRARDEKLWKSSFIKEGWVLDRARMDAYEHQQSEKKREVSQSGGEAEALTLERRSSRKRGRDEAFSDAEAEPDAHPSEHMAGVSDLDGPVDERSNNEGELDAMEGVETASTPHISGKVHDGTLLEDIPNPADFPIAPPAFQPYNTPDEAPKLSWPYLYKQRRRLESNWDAGKCKAFQLPHPDHLDEGHRECVYTIQHTASHLVSGSRDQTIRIWDLATLRLKTKPLQGHEASVLCLQFDERPDHDIIVSGGSDHHVMVWKFSTGEVVKKLSDAHEESVLNLRFDDRYIITCSKDKTIKVWNRHALARDSDVIPNHVLNTFALAGQSGADDMIAEYSLLTTLLGHNAAVNAVMIHGNIIVSASGDRTMKSWDIHLGKYIKTYHGHSKGIACVQFDGRRIVSGSSDNTVRIFDAESTAEVACLSGHSNLVRTVQARFGDLDIVSMEELADEARQADMEFYAALSRGMTPGAVSRRQGGATRNAGSSRPENMLAVGTKVPPGGGGSRWAKIVSGSYDETVILWRKNKDGDWCPKVRLSQEDVLRPGNRRRVALQAVNTDPAGNAVAPVNMVANGAHDLAQAQAHHHITTAHGHLAQANQLIQTQHQQGQAHQLIPPSQMAAMASAQNHLSQQLGQQSAAQQQHNAPATQDQAANAAPAAVAANNQQQANNNQAAQPTAANQQQANQMLQQNQQQVAAVQQANQPAAAGAGGGAAAAAVAGGGAAAQQPAHRESNRVFKLQFDARRIVCCSQNKTIVGWDFANGDPELERIGEWSLETA